MNDIIEIPKWNGNREMKPAWVYTVDSNDNVLRPHIICICGDVTNIGNHHIHEDGTITASYYHCIEDCYPIDEDGKIKTMIGCRWHVFLKMKDWIGLEFLPGTGSSISKVVY